MNAHVNTAIALLKRETWEHRSFWIVPTVIAGLMLFFFLYAMIYAMPHEIGYDLWVDRMSTSDHEALERIGTYLIPGLAAPFFMMMVFVSSFYLLDALYSERRDRSILFWKSLPVNDTATVFSKWGAVLVVFPAIVFAIVVLLSLLMTLLTGLFVIFGGGNAWTLVWQHYSLFDGLGAALTLFYVETLWYLPVMGWLLLASAWAKKAPFLWAALPPVGIAVLEKMFLDSDHFLDLVGGRLAPFGGAHGFEGRIEEELELFGDSVSLGTAGFDYSVFGDLFTTAGFWYGLLFAAACTAGAIWLRRYRDES
ncbi:MAG TPA: ABC-2 transporter permease [Gammaproteobacteria bacterium]